MVTELLFVDYMRKPNLARFLKVKQEIVRIAMMS